MADKNDVFVGNLTFNTTEEQLRKMFQFMGPIKNIRILLDKETGKSRGFAFVEYYDASAALSAIKSLDGTEVNGRKIKVSFPSQSHLKDAAKDFNPTMTTSSGNSVPLTADELENRQQKLLQVVNEKKLHELWDILDAMKKLVMDDKRGVKVKSILISHPQLVTAIYEIQKRLGIVLPAHIQQQQLQMQKQQQYPNNSKASSISNAPIVGKISASALSSSVKPYHHQPYSNNMNTKFDSHYDDMILPDGVEDNMGLYAQSTNFSIPAPPVLSTPLVPVSYYSDVDPHSLNNAANSYDMYGFSGGDVGTFGLHSNVDGGSFNEEKTTYSRRTRFQ